MSYEDPRSRDRRFPNRPTHQDFIDLADVVQGNDTRAETGLATPVAILGIDEASLMYFIEQRFGTLSQATGGALPAKPDPLLMALYFDAMAVGKGLGEVRARRELRRAQFTAWAEGADAGADEAHWKDGEFTKNPYDEEGS